MSPAILPPPDLHPLVQAQVDAAHFYIWLALACFGLGLAIVAVPLVITVPEAFVSTTLHVGGGLVAAVGTFPSGKYLQRRDRASALQMISSQYGVLERSGSLATPARRKLDQQINQFVERLMK
jgi:hypothetical protein